MVGANEKKALRIFAGIHVLTLAICTYVAAIEIETILATSFLCSLTGIALGVLSLRSKDHVMAFAGFLTPVLAIVLFVLEAFFLNLGPDGAAMPFCIVFIVNQTVATLMILIKLNLDLAAKGTAIWQLTIRMLFVLTFSFSVFFGIARLLLNLKHNWIMWIALGLLGLTAVGLSMVVYSSRTNPQTDSGYQV